MTKKLLAASLFTVCITTTALTSGYSFAKDADIYFYPKQKWVVEQVGEGFDGKLKICVLSNKLNNGYIMQIAGNSDGFTNLNIDFRQNSFKQNHKYEVKYSIPGILDSLIPTKAFKENLLVSDLRGNAEFAKSLRSASVLDVQIRDTSFRIYMTGIDAAMGKYEDCVRPPEILKLEDDQHLSVSTNTAGKSVDVMKEVAVPSYAAPVQLKNVDLAPPPPQIDLAGESGNVQQSSLQGEVLPEHKLRPLPPSEPRYTERLAKQLREESEKYKPETVPEDEGVQANDVIEPEASAFHIDEKPEEELSIDVAADVITGEEVIADASMVMDEAAQALAGIEPTVGQGNLGNEDEFIAMRDKISELEEQIGILLDKNKMLDDELKATLQDSEDERLSISSNNWNLERATMKFNEAERQIMRLGRKLQTQKAQCQYEKTELENMLFDPELTNQNQLASLSLLEEELDNVKSDLYRQQRQYEERIRLLEKQLEAQ